MSWQVSVAGRLAGRWQVGVGASGVMGGDGRDDGGGGYQVGVGSFGSSVLMSWQVSGAGRLAGRLVGRCRGEWCDGRRWKG